MVRSWSRVFSGTLIALEKAVAIGRTWAYLGPAAAGIRGIALALTPDPLIPRLLFLGGSLVLVAVSLHFVRLAPALSHDMVLGGAALWAAGNGLWLSGFPVWAVAPLWASFLLLTIAGERLDLNRILRPSRASRLVFLLGALGAGTGGLLASLGFQRGGQVVLTARGSLFEEPLYAWGVRGFGASLVPVALWLLANDLARLAIRKPRLSRFMAASLLLGYGWLAVSGVLFGLHGGHVAGELYDGALHAFFLGFVFSTIFAHGPVIFPVMVGRPIDFHHFFYAPPFSCFTPAFL